jgi:hypothetical protein
MDTANSLWLLAALGSLSLAACSAPSGEGSRASGGVTTGGGAGIAAGGTWATGGTGGGIAESGSGTGGLASDAACSAVRQKAESGLQPADIVFALDNSGSMDEEAKFVQTHMNVFSSAIFQANVEARVVIISAGSGQSNGVCIAPPLGSGQCPSDDKPPNYLHVKQSVGSNNALSRIVELFPQYASMLRAGASKHFVVVSDDNSSMSAAAFDQQIVPLLQGVDPLYSKYLFHGIYGFSFPSYLTCFGNPAADPCCAPGFPFVYTAAVGKVYATLVQQTGGVAGNLCLQNFLPVFQALSQSVVQSSKLACEWAIPPPDEGTIDPSLVNVELTVGGATHSLGNVASASDCSSVQGGWYFDDPTAPTKVFACPETCQLVQGASDAEIEILFGCATQPAVPQ